MGKVPRMTLLCLILSGLLSSPARADNIPLTGGFLDFRVSVNQSIGPFELVGERGFTFTGFHRAFFAEPVGDPLTPGTSVNFDAKALGLDFTGTATLDGATYPDVGGVMSASSAGFHLTSLVTLPSVVSAPAVLTAPFLLNLEFYVPGGPHTLFGSGFATITLREDLGFGVPSWRLEHLRADLSSTPIPEPTTLLLVGSAAGLALARARRRR